MQEPSCPQKDAQDRHAQETYGALFWRTRLPLFVFHGLPGQQDYLGRPLETAVLFIPMNCWHSKSAPKGIRGL